MWTSQWSPSRIATGTGYEGELEKAEKNVCPAFFGGFFYCCSFPSLPLCSWESLVHTEMSELHFTCACVKTNSSFCFYRSVLHPLLMCCLPFFHLIASVLSPLSPLNAFRMAGAECVHSSETSQARVLIIFFFPHQRCLFIYCSLKTKLDEVILTRAVLFLRPLSFPWCCPVCHPALRRWLLIC